MRLLTAAPGALLLTSSLALALPAGTTPATAAARTASEPAITITARSARVERGDKVVVTGVVRSKRVTRVTLQQKRPGTRWKAQSTAKVRPNGTYRLKDEPTTAVTRAYRVVSATGPRRRSAKVTVGVYEWRSLTTMVARSNSGWDTTENARMNGVTYAPAWGSIWTQQPIARTVDFNVDRACVALRGRFGVGDTSDARFKVTVSVLSDDVPVYANTFGLTQSEYVTVALDEPFRVALRSTVEDTGPSPAPVNAGAVAVAGRPEVLCTSS